jgi:hypothetical protein
MEFVNNWINTVALILGGSFALYQFYKQTQALKAKNLNETWRIFYQTQEFMDLFTMMDQTNQGLSSIEPQIKLRFLAYLAEVYTHASLSQIDKKRTISLFQWHFYYAFIDGGTKNLFWKNIINTDKPEEIEKELNKKYWSNYYSFAKDCEKTLRTNGDI